MDRSLRIFKCISIFSLLAFSFQLSAGGLLANTDFSRCTPSELKNHLYQLKKRESASGKKDKFDLNEINIGGTTILLNAAKKTKYAEIIKILVSEKADINAKDSNGLNALMVAARYNLEPAVTKELINSKLNIAEKTADGMTALMIAAKYNPKAQVIEYLLEAGADRTEKNNEGQTALDIAKAAGNSAAIEELTKNSLLKLNFMTCAVKDIRERLNDGADVNEKDPGNGATALMLAARDNRNPSVARALLKAGADIFAKDFEGKSALDYARIKNNAKVEKLLMKEGVPETPKEESKKQETSDDQAKQPEVKKEEPKKEEAPKTEAPEQNTENPAPAPEKKEVSEEEKDDLI